MILKAGKNWSFDCQLIEKKPYDSQTYLATFDINNGAKFVFQCMGNIILTGWYDKYQGPKVNDWTAIYIWNSKEISTTGKLKRTFNMNKKDLEVLL